MPCQHFNFKAGLVGVSTKYLRHEVILDVKTILQVAKQFIQIFNTMKI